MLTELLRELRNFFPDTKNVVEDDYTISGGVILPLHNIIDGQYFLISGSRLNDGVYQKTPTGIVGDFELQDEEFTGTIAGLRIPNEVIALAEKIDAYVKKNGEESSPYTSEAFGGYSYTRATKSDGSTFGWKDAFSSDLRRWRKI